MLPDALIPLGFIFAVGMLLVALAVTAEMIKPDAAVTEALGLIAWRYAGGVSLGFVFGVPVLAVYWLLR